MGKARKAWRARTGFTPHGFSAAEPRRLLNAARPAAEAALLAAVALGCAQMGMSALTANSAHSSSPDATSDAGAPTPAAAAPIRSPRMADDEARSGAIFVLEGQDQRAFSVGQEVAPGVRLSAVAQDHITVAYEGAERRIAIEQAPQRFSFARALMGEAQSAPPPAEVRFLSDAPETAPVSAPAPTPFTAHAAPPAAATPAAPTMEAWLAATLSQVEAGAAPGWRIAGPVPDAAAAAGLRSGDLVVSINGYGPERSAEAAGAAAQGVVRLEIVRDGAPVAITLGDDRRT
jgi:type II secretory pathway component PulC